MSDQFVEIELSSDLFDDPCFEDMSASAIAVLDAYMEGYGWLDSPTKKDCRGVAAALRAAADQVVPDEPRAPRRGMRPGGTGALSPEEDKEDQRAATRRKLLALAAELDPPSS